MFFGEKNADFSIYVLWAKNFKGLRSEKERARGRVCLFVVVKPLLHMSHHKKAAATGEDQARA